MNIKVKKLYDIAKVVVPKEMTMWKVTDEEIQEQLKTLSMLSAEERDADTAETGDCVKCFCLSGGLKDRTVLIYPGKEIPGAEEAEQAVMGITVGTEFAVELNGEQELKVEKIIRRIPVVVDDALVQKQNIQGVSTVDEYCEWYRQTTGEINREQALKQIKIYYLEAMAEKSELEYDKAEMEIWVEGQVQQYVAEMEAMGQKEELSEEMLGQMKEQCAASRFGEAVAKAICEEQGIFFTADMFEDELKQMAEEMPGMEDMLDEYAQMYVGNAYTGKAIELLDEQAQALSGGIEMASRELTGLQEMEECIKTGYTVVDCYGDFCAACVMLAPVFEAAAGEMAEIKFAKLNVTTHADVAEKYGIMAMPTLLFFRDGVLVHQVIGSLDKRDLRDQIAIMLYQ